MPELGFKVKLASGRLIWLASAKSGRWSDRCEANHVPVGSSQQ